MINWRQFFCWLVCYTIVKSSIMFCLVLSDFPRISFVYWKYLLRFLLPREFTVEKFTAESEAGHQQLSSEFLNGSFNLLQQTIYRFKWIKILKTISRRSLQGNSHRGFPGLAGITLLLIRAVHQPTVFYLIWIWMT